jgi:hypothetical protein
MLLDDMIQTKIITDAIIKKISQILPYATFTESFSKRLLLIFVIQFVPRLLLLFLFMIDIFYFKRISLMYYFIWIGIIPLVIRYLIYVLDKTKERYTKKIIKEEDYWGGCPVKIIPITDVRKRKWEEVYECTYEEIQKEGFDVRGFREFITVMTLIFVEEGFRYEPCDLTEKDREEFFELTPIVLNLHAFVSGYYYILDRYSTYNRYNLEDKRHLYLKELNIIMYAIYLIIWVYILIISLPSFHLTIFDLIYMNKFQDTTNPFSGS